MLTTTLALALAGAPPALLDQLPGARQTLTECADPGCDPADGARAAWIVALGTYLETGVANGELAATVHVLDADLFAELPPVLQDAITEPADWALADAQPVPDFGIAPPAEGTAAVLPLGGELSPSVERFVERKLHRDVSWSPPADLPELEDRLRKRVNECSTPLEPMEFRAIASALSDDQEFYVALGYDKGRETQVWRLDRPMEMLLKVGGVGRSVDTAVEGPVHVVVLPWSNDPYVASAKQLPLFDEGVDVEYHIVDDIPDTLVPALMTHPNECQADLGSKENWTYVRDLARQHDGTVLFVTGPNRRWLHAWRWDEDTGNLARVML